jgi:hypothetical protein
MLSIFGRVIGKKNRLRLDYEGEWLKWSAAASYGDEFPSFDEWLARRNRETSVREKIRHNLRGWTALAAVQASYIGLFTGLYLTGIIPMRSWLSGTIPAGLFLAYNVRMLTLTIRAMHAYKTNPIAAYIVEMRNTFGPARKI